MNVIVIVSDSLRADHVGAYPNCRSYAGKKVQTPNIDRLAAEGTLFENHYAESLPTMPTRTTWWTGRVNFPFRRWQPFENSDYLLAEVLWSRGYTSVLITDTYHMHKPVYNCGRGFDYVRWVRGQEYDPWVVDPKVKVNLDEFHRLDGKRDDLWKPRFSQYLRNRSTFRDEEDWFAPRVTTEAIRWLDEYVHQRGQRDNLFIWVDYFDPHEPWDPPEPYWSMYKDPNYSGLDMIDPVAGPVKGYMTPAEVERTMSLYAGEVTYVDKWVGVLMDHIRQLGLHENSLIMFVSDHGAPFGEHGIIRKARPWNYEELVHIPWIIRHPEGIGAGKRVRSLVQPTDLMPTVLDYLDIREDLILPYTGPRQTEEVFPQDMVLDTRRIGLHGASVLPLMTGEAEQIRKFAFTGYHARQWSIQDLDWRLLVDMEGPPGAWVSGRKGSGPPQLFSRKSDPDDKNNVASKHPEVVEQYELELWRWAGSLK